MNWIANLLILLGLAFIAIATVGLYRFPDFYTRAHVIGKPDTLGGILLLTGLMIYSGWSFTTVKLALILVFFSIGNPAASHVLTRAAMKSGLQPWSQAGEGRRGSSRVGR